MKRAKAIVDAYCGEKDPHLARDNEYTRLRELGATIDDLTVAMGVVAGQDEA